jgi:putative transposase
MKRARHTEEQIIQILQEAQAGAAVAEVCRRHGISQATFYKWRQKFGGLQVSDAKRLRLLEEENRKLKKLVADQALDAMVLKELLAKKF